MWLSSGCARARCRVRRFWLRPPRGVRNIARSYALTLLWTGWGPADRPDGRGGRMGSPAAGPWRNHFVDLRDREGLLQVVFDPDAAEVFREAERLRNEFVIRVKGRVRARPEGTVNANLASGRVELLAGELELLNRSEPLPFQLDEQVGEEVRLKYRYLDLRREVMNQRLRLRHRLTRAMRGFLDGHGFIDLETPMLTKATPEGARDYLVPSRTHAGKFFALPQSPQIFKQLLMMAGFDRYYQIVRCFRDEDL